MPGLSADQILKMAKRLHFEGRSEEAIKEYYRVLDVDPLNQEAISGLTALGAELPLDLDERARQETVQTASAFRTNFYDRQAQESNVSILKSGPIKVIIAALGLLMVFGVYVLAQTVMNWDHITAQGNVDVKFVHPKQKEDGSATVDVLVANFNPGPVSGIAIAYNIADGAGNPLKEGKVTIDQSVPAGDKRTFKAVALGQIKGRAGKMQVHVEGLKYKKPAKLSEKMTEKFIEAASKGDKESFDEYSELVSTADSLVPAWIGLGRAYAAKGEYKKAIEHYTRAIEIGGEDANAYYLMAVAQHYSGDKVGARQNIEKAYALAPDDPEIAYNYKFLLTEPPTKK